MYKIVCKKELNPSVTYMEIEAPFVARKAKAGQFIIFQKVGLSTNMLGQMNEGDYLLDFVGPLGKPTEVEGMKRVCVVGGGVGCAIAYPSAKAFKEAGVEVDVIVGFRNKDIVILEDEFKAASDNLYLMTDDGSYGEKGFVTVKLQELLESGREYDEVLAIGPIPMMKFVAKTTEPFGVKTIVSLNPIMVDGTGMCGGCRVTVGGEVKFACVDGPDFDGHKVDFAELMNRYITSPTDRQKVMLNVPFLFQMHAISLTTCYNPDGNMQLTLEANTESEETAVLMRDQFIALKVMARQMIVPQFTGTPYAEPFAQLADSVTCEATGTAATLTLTVTPAQAEALVDLCVAYQGALANGPSGDPFADDEPYFGAQE